MLTRFTPLAAVAHHSSTLTDLQTDGTRHGASKRGRLDGQEADSSRRYGSSYLGEWTAVVETTVERRYIAVSISA